MKKYELWDRKSDINGVPAKWILDDCFLKKYKGDIILIYDNEGKVSNIERKDILAKIRKIDVNLPLDEFMEKYFGKSNRISLR